MRGRDNTDKEDFWISDPHEPPYYAPDETYDVFVGRSLKMGESFYDCPNLKQNFQIAGKGVQRENENPPFSDPLYLMEDLNSIDPFRVFPEVFISDDCDLPLRKRKEIQIWAPVRPIFETNPKVLSGRMHPILSFGLGHKSTRCSATDISYSLWLLATTNVYHDLGLVNPDTAPDTAIPIHLLSVVAAFSADFLPPCFFTPSSKPGCVILEPFRHKFLQSDGKGDYLLTSTGFLDTAQKFAEGADMLLRGAILSTDDRKFVKFICEALKNILQLSIGSEDRSGLFAFDDKPSKDAKTTVKPEVHATLAALRFTAILDSIILRMTWDLGPKAYSYIQVDKGVEPALRQTPLAKKTKRIPNSLVQFEELAVQQYMADEIATEINTFSFRRKLEVESRKIEMSTLQAYQEALSTNEKKLIEQQDYVTFWKDRIPTEGEPAAKEYRKYQQLVKRSKFLIETYKHFIKNDLSLSI